MKRRTISAFILGLLALLDLPHVGARATCTTTVNPDQATVQAAVNAAADGAIICLNAGSVIYNNPVNLSTKAVEIRGAGAFGSPWGSAGLTIINLGGSAIAFTGFESTGHSTMISNIKFTYGVGSANSPFGIITWNRQGGVVGLKPWIIHHNDFEVTGRNDSPKILMTGALGGLIYRNRFTNEALAPDYITTNLNPVAHYITDDGSWWGSANTLGSADTTGFNNLYVETNYFKNFAVAIDQNTSSRVVWRFNEMHNSSMSGHGFDSSSSIGERHLEAYNNDFICNDKLHMTAWIAKRGGTGMIFNNTFAAFASQLCGYPDGRGASILFDQYKLRQCEPIGGWPGTYPDAYPVSHQVGWGWINGSNQTIGNSTSTNQPGGSGFQQAREPYYIFNNTSNTNSLVSRSTGYVGDCRAMAYSNTGKTSGTTLTATAYVSTGQHAVVAFADLVGGTAPTITDNLGHTWTALESGANGNMRLSAWHARMTANGRVTVRITFNSSPAARAATLVTLRQLMPSPLDRNPLVVISNSNPYTGPSTGTLTQSDEIVLGYFALNGPTSHGGAQFVNDSIFAMSPDQRAVSSGWTPGQVGIDGTTGGVSDSNVSIAVTYRYVSSSSAVQPKIMNSTANRNGIAGTVTFKNNGTNPDLQVTDFIQPNREYYEQTASFNGTSGTGSGPRSARPVTCTPGVAYWSTDQGSWNTSGSGGQGVLDKCVATNSWQNAWYVPYNYPHPRTDATPSTGTDATPPSVSISIR